MFLVTLAFLALFAATQPLFEPKQFKPADRIVVLGGGMDPDGTLHLSSSLRVDKAVQVYKSGAAPNMHFSGGVGKPDGPSAGEQMAAYAISQGVPKAATSFEGKSQSTLQNALFSAPYLQNDARIIVVTEGFHLPRSWVSMRLFGNYDIALAHSVPFRQSSPNSDIPQVTMTIREALAIWFNAARYIVWQAAPVFGIENETRDALLY